MYSCKIKSDTAETSLLACQDWQPW